MAKEIKKCDICDKIGTDFTDISQEIFKSIGYVIPCDHLPDTWYAKNIENKIKMKTKVSVGKECNCEQLINIASIHRAQKDYYTVTQCYKPSNS